MVIALFTAALLQAVPVTPSVAWSAPPRIEMPPKALQTGVTSGKVILRCAILDNGVMTNCTVVFETPSGQGFGREALRAVRTARAQPGQEGSHDIVLDFASR